MSKTNNNTADPLLSISYAPCSPKKERSSLSPMGQSRATPTSSAPHAVQTRINPSHITPTFALDNQAH